MLRHGRRADACGTCSRLRGDTASVGSASRGMRRRGGSFHQESALYEPLLLPLSGMAVHGAVGYRLTGGCKCMIPRCRSSLMPPRWFLLRRSWPPTWYRVSASYASIQCC